MTNNDVNQLYDRPTAIQLKQIDRRCIDIWGMYGLGRVLIPKGVWMYGECTDVGGYIRGIQMYGRHVDVWVHNNTCFLLLG